jgi:SAM-dependent methyltransferase
LIVKTIRLLFILVIAFLAISPTLDSRLASRAEDQPTTTAEPKKDHKHEHPATGRKPANIMGFLGAPWLERSDRDQEERPDLVLKAMEFKGDEVVADLGCGTGYFTRKIAPLVPKGKVLAVDIQPQMIAELKKYIEKDGFTNVVPIVSEETDPLLPKGGVDWILLVDVYHEFQDPQPMLAKMLESLSPNGKVALVEYRLLGESAKHIKIEHRMSVKQVLAEWNPAGFELVDLIEELPSQHLFIFRRRPEYPTPGKDQSQNALNEGR